VGVDRGTCSPPSKSARPTTAASSCRGTPGATSSTSRWGRSTTPTAAVFIFAPEVGLHENVHELDFSSLYPNIICTRNVSPDVIRCDCHSDRDDVPGLGYSICDDRGYLVDVLQPIIDARDEIKAAIRHEKDGTIPTRTDWRNSRDGRER